MKRGDTDRKLAIAEGPFLHNDGFQYWTARVVDIDGNLVSEVSYPSYAALCDGFGVVCMDHGIAGWAREWLAKQQ